MFCTKCGKELKSDFNKCPYCGQDIVLSVHKGSVGEQRQNDDAYAIKKTSPQISMKVKVILGFWELCKKIGELLIIVLILACIILYVKYSNKESDESDWVYDNIKANSVDTDSKGNILENMLSENSFQINNISIEQDYYGDSKVYLNMTTDMGTDVETITLAVLAWDNNGLPIKTYIWGRIAPSSYWNEFKISNIPEGGTVESSFTLACSEIRYILIYPVSVNDFDGNIWENPEIQYYKNEIAGKKYNHNSGAYEMIPNNL